MIEQIPLSKLKISAKNVRTVNPNSQDDKDLIAGIRTAGLLQNLVVHQEGKDFFVAAGGRRYAALRFLRDDTDATHITDDYLVPCLVADPDADIAELSLMENVQRAKMHPADEFMAYQTMADGGKSVEQIARRFNSKKSEVKRLLKLACVNPALIGLFKEDKLSLECVMAFTVSEDHDRQMAAYRELSGGFISAHKIKQFLTGSSVTNKSPIAKYVTVRAYKAAGGSVMEDLFQNSTYLADHELLLRLAAEKLQLVTVTHESEGWKWVEFEAKGDVPTHEYYRQNAEPVGVPKKLASDIEAATALAQTFEDMDWSDMDESEYDAQEKLETAAQEKLEKLEEKLNKYRSYSAEQKAVSGVIVSFDSDGELVVYDGLVKKSDMKAARALEQCSDGNQQEGSTGSEPAASGVESAALVADLKTYRGQIGRAAIMAQPKVAMDVVHFNLCDPVLRDAPHWERARLVDVSITADSTNVLADDLRSTRAGEEIASIYSSLNTSWCSLESGAERFEAFCVLKAKEKEALVAYVVGLSLNSSIFDDDENEGRALVSKLNLTPAEYWRPTDINYLKRVTRNRLLAIGGELLGSKWAEEHGNAKKGELVSALHSTFNDTDQVSEELRSSIDNWMPDVMAV